MHGWMDGWMGWMDGWNGTSKQGFSNPYFAGHALLKSIFSCLTWHLNEKEHIQTTAWGGWHGQGDNTDKGRQRYYSWLCQLQHSVTGAMNGLKALLDDVMMVFNEPKCWWLVIKHAFISWEKKEASPCFTKNILTYSTITHGHWRGKHRGVMRYNGRTFAEHFIQLISRK